MAARKIPRVTRGWMLEDNINRSSFTGVVSHRFIEKEYEDFYVNGEWRRIENGKDQITRSRSLSGIENPKFEPSNFWKEIYKYYISIGDDELAREAASHLLGQDD